VVVERICRELAGHSCLELSEVTEPKQQIIRSRSFGQLVTDKEALQAAVTTHISSALEALREQNSVASIVSVFLDTNRFRQQDAQYHASQSAALAFPMADTIEFNRVAMALLNQLFRPEYLYKKAGVMIAGIESATGRQVDLFAPEPAPEREKLMQTLDTLNGRYGRGTVQLATAIISEDWRMSRKNLSPCYTTRLKDLVVAR
jgi:DNA polymerase V